MALRDFTDSAGRRWTVWSVRPRSEIRLRSTPRQADVDHHDLLRGGWLAFETEGERRRLVPIPIDWESADATALERLCAEADPVPPRRRLIE